MDILAGLCELLGLILIGNYYKLGFVCNIVGCILWVFVVCFGGPIGLLFVVLPGIYINIINYKKWRDNAIYSRAV